MCVCWLAGFMEILLISERFRRAIACKKRLDECRGEETKRRNSNAEVG